MNHKNLFKLLCFLLLIFAFELESAQACSCGQTPNVLESFEDAGNVVIVKAVAVEKIDTEKGEYAVDGVKSTKMVVEKVYKGRLKAGDEMYFAQGGGADCIWTFNEKSIGRQYLFYLGDGDKDEKMWIGFGCGRSSSVEGAADDLLFLNNLDKVRGKSRISGTINFTGYINVPDEPSIEGRKIKIVRNGKTFNLKTDKNGVYEIYDLPGGKYQIIPEIPKGWKVETFYLSYSPDFIGKEEDENIKEFPVKLENKKHATLDFHFEIDNALRGKIYDPNGNLMKGVCIRLYPPTGVTKDFIYKADCTEENGAFEIKEVPPGSYILVANDENKITSSEPFKTLYYPGVFELEKAAVINLGLGDSREELNFQVPKTEELITIEGVFLYSDGKPVAGESVQFESEKNQTNYDYNSRATTDSQGRFKLKILKGMKGKVFGSMYTYLGEFEKCPKLDALIKATGKTSFEPKTEEIEISGEDNVYNIELTFSFPGCKKSED